MKSDVVFSRAWNGWPTPLDLYSKLHGVFEFDIDLAADKENSLCERYFGEEQNSLAQDWKGVVGFLNPPYNIGKNFISKCIEENEKAKLICVLIPARVDTQWFHSVPEGTWCFFFKGRLKFGRKEKNPPAPFPSCLLFFGKDRFKAKRMVESILEGSGKWVIL